jgi:2-oxoisovalerate dehydrogenase E1 component
MWGEDVATKEKGGVFNVSKGMQQEFGYGRVHNAPIAEDYIVGSANGFSRFDDKIRVLVEGAEFADYFWPAMEQTVEMGQEYWRTRGQFSPNVTIRIASGGYITGGLYHSQNIEGSLLPLPEPEPLVGSIIGSCWVDSGPLTHAATERTSSTIPWCMRM